MPKFLKGRGLPLEQTPIPVLPEGASRITPGHSLLFPEGAGLWVSSVYPLAEDTWRCL